MKLLRAHFENFRLLKDVTLVFSTDADRNVTVVRAPNESGKTTALTALQWGLFGDIALPGGGSGYRLHPLDSPTEGGTQVRICVEIEYEVQGKMGARHYRLVRSAIEDIDGDSWKRHSPTLQLFQVTPTGTDLIENPDAHIRPHLPLDLREVFFTDGDRALSFIEGARGDQMRRVEGAIRSLLGLSVVEEAMKHVSQVAKGINKRVKDESGAEKKLESISENIDRITSRLPEMETELERLRAMSGKLDDLEREADRALSEALRKGNRDELAAELEKVRKSWAQCEKDARQAARDHADLFRSQTLAREILSGSFIQAKNILDELHDQKKIPNQAIPVLEERLSQPTCICGESLTNDTPEGKRRRREIELLISSNREADEVQERVTALYYSSKELLAPVGEDGWADEYSAVFARRQSANQRLSELGGRERELEARIARLPNLDVQQLRAVRDQYRGQRQDTTRDEATLIAGKRSLEEDLGSLRKKQEALLKTSEKGKRLLAELEVAHDLQSVLQDSLEAIRTRELHEVSRKMNEFFLDMIGADPDQRSVIHRAEITPDFRIIVFGESDRELDPSQDLNGASRRALTIAFILALTKVSEVEAPNVIDTPLGMMDGFVKRSVLKRASGESSQLILFLTHSEIASCEDIIDEKAGQVLTMTNPAHYPRILANPPPVSDARVLICKCNHRSHCEVCEQRTDAAAD